VLSVRKRLSVLDLLIWYRVLALGIGFLQLSFKSQIRLYFPIPTTLILSLTGLYTFFVVLATIKYLKQGKFNEPKYTLIRIDLIACVFLVFLTGGLYSPFLLYTLAPVLASALLFSSRVTFIIAAFSVFYIVITHTVNPFFPSAFSSGELSYLMVYIIAITLASILPYMINANLRQRLQAESTILERNRLSRELHDGIAQTLAVLHWQTQLIQRQLYKSGLNQDGIVELDKLVDKAQLDMREALEILHNNVDSGSLLSQIRMILQNISKNNRVKTYLNNHTNQYNLTKAVELELLRICQEALTNVRKHANAKHVWIDLMEQDGYLQLCIKDDGRGFDSVAYFQGEGIQPSGFGLAVMKERVESINGSVEVSSVPGSGTKVVVRVPSSEKITGVLWKAIR